MTRNRHDARALFLIVCTVAAPAARADRIVFETESPFNHIVVRDTDRGERELVFAGGTAIQSAVRVGRPGDLVLAYTRVAMAGLALVPEPRRILVIGLGGGSMPMFLHRAYPQATIDVAELDPVVAEVAKRFFDFREDARLKVHIGDGRAFVEKTRNRYDLIFLDAYGEDSIPRALATREFLVAVRKILQPGGAVVANLWSAPLNELYHSMLRTYQSVFDELHLLRVGDKANRILLAIPGGPRLTKRELVRRAGRVRAPGTAELRLASLIESGYQERPRILPTAAILLDTRPADEAVEAPASQPEAAAPN
jgi:spermidine synthase